MIYLNSQRGTYIIAIFTNILLILSLTTFICYLLWFYIFNFERVRDIKKQKQADHFDLYIMVPLLNEENTIFSYINDLINELNQIDQTINPNILLLDDASDDDTLRNLHILQNSLHHLRTKVYILERHFPNAQQGKGASLNFGLDFISKLPTTLDKQHTIIGIIDADGFISAKDINDIIGTFENNQVSMVQSAVAMNRRDYNWLSKMQDTEFLGANSFMQESRNRLGQAIASGNGQFLTLQMAQDVRWGNSLLEDFEFTVRGLFKQHRAIFLPSAIVYQEAVTSLRPLLRQRIRWCEGSMQCFVKYTKKIIQSKVINPGVKIDLSLFLILPFFSMLLNIANICSIIVQLDNIFTRKSIPVLIVFGIVVCATLLVWLMMAIEYHQNTQGLSLFTCILRAWQCILYNFILSFIPYAAFAFLLMGRNSWAKTSHGT
ncbi:family 2 glycosyl transferase [Companilactobacillus versmoldensis DSM 14857 = KCTC 3814]|uniref:Family 2 glycosyl transferase n=2 Tax=Companilactobacillus versmoldensis TaxID=194326 RepID=A0A0R1SPQ2_9LACO|nr:family 2 glycosyl transferase [Companilactobacillus versmoldensis DSM 14857 = KCTC 3814]